MLPRKNPISPEERKRLLQSFADLPPKEKEAFSRAAAHLRWLTILWDLEEADTEAVPSIPEKRHILLAYKLLQILWFNELPEQSHQTFMIYVRERIPDDQSPEKINQAFDTSSEELAELCKDIVRPDWLNDAIVVKTSLEAFPQKSR
jgi:hypothetical protein